MYRFILLFTLLTALAAAENRLPDFELKQMIGRMLIVGFDGERLDFTDPFVKQLQRYRPGGVILFDRDFYDRNRVKNIRSPQQLKALTRQLQAYAPSPLLISVDQEGGKVARLKPAYGFGVTPPAAAIGARNDPGYARMQYTLLARQLAEEGINTDFAPVVDLAVNPKNYVIVGLERSYGRSPGKVAEFAGIFLDALRRQGCVGVLKHFPGHGSSLGDSHKGFVDVSDTWSDEELEPYRLLFKAGKADMVMTAHVFNAHLDPEYPATLSYDVNTKLLRETLGFEGVIVSDDLQMGAISSRYTLAQTVTQAINAGVDMLLFGNQLGQTPLSEAVGTIFDEVKAGHIPEARIIEANRRILQLFETYGIGGPRIVERPIAFGQTREALTKAYIKTHYGLDVGDITIDPKAIVLHWTATMDADDAFGLLAPEILPGSRGDIASAGALNVSAHFLVDRDGTIYRLMPENKMARHVIGLNYGSIGIENVGGESNREEDLTPAQLEANIALVRYLKRRYPGIRYLLGHHEYLRMEHTPLWLERDQSYRTDKRDPGDIFMRGVRNAVTDLNLSAPPETQ